MQEYICYHGSCEEITKFSHDFMGECTYQNAGGFYFSDDEYIANDYAIESYKRKYDGEFEDEILQENAIKQGNIYKCKVSFENPLILEGHEIETRNKYSGIIHLDIQKVMAIINIMQNRKYENNCEIFGEHDDIYEYFETEIYNEEIDEYEYEEKEPYDGLIIKNTIDGIADYSDSVDSTIIIALDNNQIEILERISASELN